MYNEPDLARLDILALEHWHRAEGELAAVGTLEVRHLVHGHGWRRRGLWPGGEWVGLRDAENE